MRQSRGWIKRKDNIYNTHLHTHTQTNGVTRSMAPKKDCGVVWVCCFLSSIAKLQNEGQEKERWNCGTRVGHCLQTTCLTRMMHLWCICVSWFSLVSFGQNSKTQILIPRGWTVEQFANSKSWISPNEAEKIGDRRGKVLVFLAEEKPCHRQSHQMPRRLGIELRYISIQSVSLVTHHRWMQPGSLCETILLEAKF